MRISVRFSFAKVYTEDELYAVFEAAEANIRDEAVLYLFLDSGLRPDELSSLHLDDGDIPNGILKVMGKGGIERFGLFGTEAAASFAKYVKEYRSAAGKHDALFLAIDGHPLSASGIQSLLKRHLWAVIMSKIIPENDHPTLDLNEFKQVA